MLVLESLLLLKPSMTVEAEQRMDKESLLMLRVVRQLKEREWVPKKGETEQGHLLPLSLMELKFHNHLMLIKLPTLITDTTSPPR